MKMKKKVGAAPKAPKTKVRKPAKATRTLGAKISPGSTWNHNQTLVRS